ncbi:MAG: hypothetical protein HZC37_31805 [Burkholderiales bacterium]|nr:hypothetical protein [Burkholderiales bacterium]
MAITAAVSASSSTSRSSAAIALAAALALFRFKLGVLPLLGARTLAGLAITLLLKA